MQCTIILTKLPDLHWRAFPPGWPECRAEASSREEVLDQIKHKIAEAVSHSEIVRVELPIPDNGIRVQTERGLGDDWSDYGIFSNDTTWNELFTDIEENRDRRPVGNKLVSLGRE